jgi:hypothetical protein
MVISKIAIVLVRLGAVWVVISTIQYASSFFQYGYAASRAAIFVALLIPLLVAGLMWMFPAHVARLEASELSASADSTVKDASHFLAVGIALIGLFLVANGFVDVFYWAVLVSWELGEVNMLSPETRAGVIATAIEIPVGFLLIAGRSGVRRFMYWFRYRE